MTLSISDTKSAFRCRSGKIVLTYVGTAAFCALFAAVYNAFGHGVTSPHMSLLFLYPLLGGALPFGLLWLCGERLDATRHRRFCYNAWNSGIAALTVGSLVRGICAIAGATTPYTPVYTVCGGGMMGAGLLVWLSDVCRTRRIPLPPTD